MAKRMCLEEKKGHKSSKDQGSVLGIFRDTRENMTLPLRGALSVLGAFLIQVIDSGIEYLDKAQQ